MAGFGPPFFVSGYLARNPMRNPTYSAASGATAFSTRTAEYLNSGIFP